MWKMVHNGYTPDELEYYDRHENRYAALGILFFIILYGGLVATSMYYDWDIKANAPSWFGDILAIWMIVWAVALVIVWLPIANLPAFRRKICRSLAGIELGVLHCSDDLVILLDLPREYADLVIDGQYDNWLKHTLTCKYIG